MSKADLPPRRRSRFPGLPEKLSRGLAELGITPDELVFVRDLWAGYGSLWRGESKDGRPCVLKVVTPPPEGSSASEQRSRLRKLESYRVERNYYVKHSDLAEEHGARCYYGETDGDAALLVLEDLDALGFNERSRFNEREEQRAALRVLASLHAKTLHREATGLWPVGTYYHLDTRPDEWRRMPQGPLKFAAEAIAKSLKQAAHQCWVHGDAKPENYCVRRNNGVLEVRAVDFQYVGRGIGVVDVAYFASCTLSPDASRRRSEVLLEDYFEELRRECEPTLDSSAYASLEEEWRQLYPLAWADLYRFLAGWAPGSYDDEPLAAAYIEDALTFLHQ